MTFVGRRAELTLIESLVGRTVTRGRGGVVLVRGEAGMGTTALLTLVLRRLQERGFAASRGRADVSDASRPFAALMEALERTRPRSQDLVELAARVRAAVEPVGPVSGPAEAPVNPAVDVVVRALVDALRQAAGPRALVLDDLQHSDLATLSVVREIVRRCEDLPVLVLLGVHAPVEARLDPVLEAVARLQREGRGAVIELGPLSEKEVVDLVAEKLPSRVRTRAEAEDLGRLAHVRAGGVPLFLEALLAQYERTGSTSAWERFAGPSLAPRLLEHDPSALEVAVAISVLPYVLERDLPYVSEVTGLEPGAAAAALTRLTRAGILVEDASRRDFHQPVVREDLYLGQGEAARMHLHGVAARHLEAVGVREADPVAWASQMVRASGPGEEAGIQAALEAARHVGGTAPLIAEEWLATARSLLSPQDPRVVTFDVLRMMLLAYSGSPLGAITIGQDLLARHGMTEQTAAATRLHVMTLLGIGRYRESLDLIAEARRAGLTDPLYAPVEALALTATDEIARARAAAAASAGDPPQDAESRHVWLEVRTFVAHLLAEPEVRTLGRQIEESCPAFGPLVELGTHAALLVISFEGEAGVHEAQRHRRRVAALMGPQGVLPRDSTHLLGEVELAFVCGGWTPALESADVSEAPDPELVEATNRDGIRALAALMLDDMDRPREAAEAVRGVIERAPTIASLVTTARARVLAGAGSPGRPSPSSGSGSITTSPTRCRPSWASRWRSGSPSAATRSGRIAGCVRCASSWRP